MGKAYTALANDGSAIFTNPAGLAGAKQPQFISMSGNLMNEVPYVMAGASWPVPYGTAAVGYVGLGVSGIRETRLDGVTPEITGVEGSYSNSALNFSYAAKIADLPGLNRYSDGPLKNTQFGANIKMVSQGYSGTFEAGNGSGLDLDLGAICTINDDLSAGLTVKNIIPGNNLKSDELPMGITAGVTRKLGQYNLLTSIDAELARSFLIHLGCEWSPTNLLRLRAGLDQKPNAGGTITNLTAGLGLNFKGFTFDYAYHTYAELSEFTTHFFSIGYTGKII